MFISLSLKLARRFFFRTIFKRISHNPRWGLVVRLWFLNLTIIPHPTHQQFILVLTTFHLTHRHSHNHTHAFRPWCRREYTHQGVTLQLDQRQVMGRTAPTGGTISSSKRARLRIKLNAAVHQINTNSLAWPMIISDDRVSVWYNSAVRRALEELVLRLESWRTLTWSLAPQLQCR